MRERIKEIYVEPEKTKRKMRGEGYFLVQEYEQMEKEKEGEKTGDGKRRVSSVCTCVGRHRLTCNKSRDVLYVVAVPDRLR